MSLPTTLLEPRLDGREEQDDVVEVVDSVVQLNFAEQDEHNVLRRDEKFVRLISDIVSGATGNCKVFQGK